MYSVDEMQCLSLKQRKVKTYEKKKYIGIALCCIVFGIII